MAPGSERHRDLVVVLRGLFFFLILARRLLGENHAAENGNEAVVKLLLQNGADVNAKSDSNETALHRAVKNGNEGVVKRPLNFRFAGEDAKFLWKKLCKMADTWGLPSEMPDS